MVKAYRLLAERGDWPLHLGVTEAGPEFQGTIKSATAFGILLGEGIGDTIRVSLCAPPAQEVKVGLQILQSLNLRERKLEIVSCPSCGRAQVDVYTLANDVTAGLEGMTVPLRVAVMGCVVNGPGEAREADLGVASGNGKGQIFVKGEVIKTVPESRDRRDPDRRGEPPRRRDASRRARRARGRHRLSARCRPPRLPAAWPAARALASLARPRRRRMALATAGPHSARRAVTRPTARPELAIVRIESRMGEQLVSTRIRRQPAFGDVVQSPDVDRELIATLRVLSTVVLDDDAGARPDEVAAGDAAAAASAKRAFTSGSGNPARDDQQAQDRLAGRIAVPARMSRMRSRNRAAPRRQTRRRTAGSSVGSASPRIASGYETVAHHDQLRRPRRALRTRTRRRPGVVTRTLDATPESDGRARAVRR